VKYVLGSSCRRGDAAAVRPSGVFSTANAGTL
jgi:hypothetical protein